MDAPLRFRRGNPLYAVDAALILESPKELRSPSTSTTTSRNPTSVGLRDRKRLDLPSTPFRIARVHAKKFCGKERGFVTTGPRTNLENGVLFRVGIFGDEQDANLLLQWPRAALLDRPAPFQRVRAPRCRRRRACLRASSISSRTFSITRALASATGTNPRQFLGDRLQTRWARWPQRDPRAFPRVDSGFELSMD